MTCIEPNLSPRLRPTPPFGPSGIPLIGTTLIRFYKSAEALQKL